MSASLPPSARTGAFGRAMLAHFPLEPAGVYLNHGTVGVAPLAVMRARRDADGAVIEVDACRLERKMREHRAAERACARRRGERSAHAIAVRLSAPPLAGPSS